MAISGCIYWRLTFKCMVKMRGCLVWPPRSAFTSLGLLHLMTQPLARALIGELPHVRGDIRILTPGGVHADIACCAQEPFIMYGTLINNIIGFSSFDNAWLESVTHAVELEKDIAALPQGRLTNDLTRQLGDASIYKYLAAHIGLRRALVFIALTCGWAVFSTIGTVWFNEWSSASLNQDRRDDAYYLGIYAAFQGLALLFLALFSGFTLTFLAVRAGTSFHEVLLKTMIWAPQSFFSAVDTGVTTNRFSQDIILVDGDMPMALLETLSAGLVALVQMFLIAVATPCVAIASPFILAILYFVQNFYLKTSTQLRFLDLEARSPLQIHLLDTIQGLATIRTFGWARHSIEVNHDLVDASQRPVYILYMQTFEADTPSENRPDNDIDKHTTPPPAKWPPAGRVSFRTITVNYSPPGTEQAILAVQDLTLKMPADHKVAICGLSGSGKSTLLGALTRMVNPTWGSIRIDGVDVGSLRPSVIRSAINTIPQDPFFFHSTIADNPDPTARAILKPSKIVLMDGATSSVDQHTANTMKQVIRDELDGVTVIAVAHQLSTILEFDVVVVMDGDALRRPEILPNC
ncbi:p-loop containing nucleoside triphosphate hydrolase protein [Apiospora saccharicola]